MLDERRERTAERGARADQATEHPERRDVGGLTGFLSGTEPLYGEMGLNVLGPITPGGAASSNTTGHVVVQFTTASARHGTLLTPDADSTTGNGNDTALLATTCEMQRQAATFLASDGATVQVNGPTCP